MAPPITVFSTDFDGSLPFEINPGSGSLTGVEGYAGYGPAGNQFGGNFLRSPGGNVVTLQLTGLPAHTALNLSFLFAAIDSLDGSGDFPAGDFFNVKVDGVSIFRESFANALEDQVQTYVPAPGVQLARRVDLGFGGPGSYYTDSAYNLGSDSAFQNIAHTASTATITFELDGPGVQDISDESWAIENLRVSVVPSGTTPAPTLALASHGGAASDEWFFTTSGVVNVGGLVAGAPWEYSTDGGQHWIAGSSASFAVTGDGRYHIVARQYDAGGNPSGLSAPLDFTLDATRATAIGVSATGNTFIDGLLIGTKWSGGITFSFPQDRQDYPYTYGTVTTEHPHGIEADQVIPVTFQQQEAVRAMLTGQSAFPSTHNVLLATSLASFIATDISEAGGLGNGLNGTGDIRVAEGTWLVGAPGANFPGNEIDGAGGDVWMNSGGRNAVLGDLAYSMWHMHELGHALGLSHSHDGGFAAVIPPDRDAIEFTVMSYQIGGSRDFPQSWMMYDIQALQALYGADYGPASNNTPTVYSWNPTTGETFINGASQGIPVNGRIFLTIWDGGGIDTYDMSNYGNSVVIDLRPGEASTPAPAQRPQITGRNALGSIYNALLFNGDTRSLIENAIGGTNSDSITGNQAANLLVGNAGGDMLDGREGADHLDGGNGNDSLFGGSGGDALFGGSGNDTIDGQDGDDSIDGGADNDTLYGGAGADTVSGGAGNDALYGGSGIDTLYGGFGVDTLVGEAGDDILDAGAGIDVLNGGTGSDTASYATAGASVSVDLLWSFGSGPGAGFDVFNSIENATGSPFNDELYGSNGANVLTGGAGNDALYGRDGQR